MTNLLPTQEQRQTALKLAKGEWQQYLVKAGYAMVWGAATQWFGKYKKSLFALCNRLREAGIEAKAFVDKPNSIFYLVIGAEWVRVLDRVEAVMSPASIVYAQLCGKKFSGEMEKELKKLKLRNRLRLLLSKCRDAMLTIGDRYGDAIRGYCDAQKAYEKALSLVEEIEELWNEMKDFVGVFLL